MEQPPGFVTDSNLGLLTQEVSLWFEARSQLWYAKIDNLFLRLGFKRCEY
jgi:hypothetical protein